MKRLLAFLLTMAMLCTVCAVAEVTDPIVNPVGTFPVVNDDLTFSILLQSSADILDYYDNYATKFMEELTGVKVEFVLYSEADSEQKLDLLINSGSKLPDIILMYLNATKIHRYAEAGAFQAMDAYYDKDTGLAEAYWARCDELGYDGEFLLNQIRDINGHIYGMVRYPINYADIYSYRAWINQAWLTKLDLPMPTTSDELYDTLVAFRDLDPNGNGEKDEIPMLGAEGAWRGNPLEYLLDMFIYFDGEDYQYGYLPLSETGGVFDVYYDKPAYQEALIYFNKLVTEGLISVTSFTDDGSQQKALAKTGQDVGIVVRGGASAAAKAPNHEYVALENMTGPEGVRYATVAVPTADATGFITADCEHPEAAFLYLESFNRDEDVFRVFRFGEEGDDWDHCEPGTPSMFYENGYDASIYDYHNVWSNQNNKIWRCESIPFLWGIQSMMVAFNGDDGEAERMNAIGVMLNEKYAPAWEDIVTVLHYTEDELDEWADTRTALYTYIDESRTLFAIGDMDPVADWDKYLAELENYHYKDIIALDQAVYERMDVAN